MENRLALTHELMRSTGLYEQPFGMHYTDILPEGAFGPKEGAEISRELEDQGKVSFAEALKNFSCFFGNIWLARKKGRAAYISKKEYGCFGGSYYMGFQPRHFKLIEDYVSLGRKGTPMHGERFMPSPEAMCRFLERLAPPPASARYCVLKPLSAFTEQEPPESVTFFTRMETLNGLQTLIYFVTGDSDAVVVHSGSACSHVVSWPRHYAARGLEKAVLGGCDPSARKFMKTDEILLTVPLSLYDKMLAAMPESALTTPLWENVMKKVNRSNQMWEGDQK